MKDTIHFVEILITQEIEIKDDCIYQTFFYDKNDKNKKYILDPSFILYDKFEAKLRSMAVFEEDIEFFERINDEGCVILKYYIKNSNAKKNINFSRKFFKLVDFAPPNKGCAYCIHKEDIDENFFKCCYRDRTMTKEVKNCKYFKQRKLYL